MKTQNVVLYGRDLYTQIIMIDEDPLEDKNRVPYKRFAFQQIAFIMREQAYHDFESGEMQGLTLVPTERVQDDLDPDTGDPIGTKSRITGFSYGGHLTATQDIRLEQHDVEKERLHRDVMAPIIPVVATRTVEKAAVPYGGYEPNL